MEIAYFCYTTLFDVLFRLGVSKVKVGVWAGGHLPFFWNVPCCNPAFLFDGTVFLSATILLLEQF